MRRQAALRQASAARAAPCWSRQLAGSWPARNGRTQLTLVWVILYAGGAPMCVPAAGLPKFWTSACLCRQQVSRADCRCFRGPRLQRCAVIRWPARPSCTACAGVTPQAFAWASAVQSSILVRFINQGCASTGEELMQGLPGGTDRSTAALAADSVSHGPPRSGREGGPAPATPPGAATTAAASCCWPHRTSPPPCRSPAQQGQPLWGPPELRWWELRRAPARPAAQDRHMLHRTTPQPGRGCRQHPQPCLLCALVLCWRGCLQAQQLLPAAGLWGAPAGCRAGH